MTRSCVEGVATGRSASRHTSVGRGRKPLTRSHVGMRITRPPAAEQIPATGPSSRASSLKNWRKLAAASWSCTARLCKVVIDPQGQVRYVIYKKFDSENRRARQHAAIHGPLKAFWKKTGRRYDLLPNVLRRVHAL